MYPANKRAERGEGYVYLMRPTLGKNSKWLKNKETCPIKIGVSKTRNGIKSRLKSMSTGNWNQLCIEYVSPKLQEPYNVEYALHRELWTKKIKGEWFEITLEECKNLKKKLMLEKNRYDPDGPLESESLTDMAYEYDMMDYPKWSV